MKKKFTMFSTLSALVLGTAGHASAVPVFVDTSDTGKGGVGALNYANFANWTVPPPSTPGFTSYSRTLHFDTTGLMNIIFANDGGDNSGALLDDVSVTPVPEPGTMVLLGAGLMGLAVAGKRRRER